MVLKVAVLEKKPFIINNDKLSGFTIDVWEHIAKKHNLQFEYHVIDKKTKINSVINNKKYDVILGRVSMTPNRISKVDYTIPYYFTNYSLVSQKEKQYQTILKPFFNAFFYIIAFICLIFLLNFVFLHKNFNDSITFTLENMFPFLFDEKRTGLFLAKVYHFFGYSIIISLFIYIYTIVYNYFNKEIIEIPKKPILVDSKNEILIKYLKTRGAQVKLVDNKGGLNNLLDLYLEKPSELAGVFVSEEGKINKDGTIFNRNPKYQGLSFNRYNFGKSQLTILVKKNHPIYFTINNELISMNDDGTIRNIAKKWLHHTHTNQLI
jgi:ABC-type amino acid transport substrate-binding protein